MAKDTIVEGVFAINKPYNLSSAQVIRDCQTHFNPSTLFSPLLKQDIANRMQESNHQRNKRSRNKRGIQVKIGHGGTLDPLATGVLILGVGKGTKSLPKFLGCTKTYETIILFGCATDSYDRAGRILKKRQYDHITRTMVEEALEGFRGKYQQMPPLYSALKMEGKPLYEYAREGKPLPREIATREVEVTEMELVEWYDPGTHDHRWPDVEATQAEKTYAEQLWRVEKQQITGKKLSPEEEEADAQALAAHEHFKRKAEERQDELVVDRQSKRRKGNNEAALMSGALGELPHVIAKGANLIAPIAPGTPPPWEGKGPPAAKIRMTVSTGFYVRSFCHDLGEKVGSAAIMAELVRERQQNFTLDDCLDYDDLAKGEAVWGPKVESMLRRWTEKEAVEGGGENEHGSSRKHKHRASKWDKDFKKDKFNGATGSAVSEAVEKAAATAAAESHSSPKATPKEGPTENGDVVETTESSPPAPENDKKSTGAAGDEEEWNGFSDVKEEQVRVEA
ncbi:Trub family pseudouridylate synthase-containing protein [Pleurostoma richardsiae]|uniref:tRNA pseudouridine(55) synthase n=1 Tax=Pleurostoma richardsiae TaxID=41990 RepID=A0AA38VPB6_9PEZI|nr:Trub family pseudouridylate synthase-containing protein [Pleurostoma richardsiae]